MEPSEILRTDKLLEFWPTAKQSAKDRVASTARFIIYATVVVFLINKDPRIFALGLLALAILYYMVTANMIKDGEAMRPTQGDGRQANPLRDPVSMPTYDNSMANVLMSDYVDYPDRPAAAWYPSVRQEVQDQWARIHPFERQRDAERNFYTTAVTTIPNDQNAFAQASYGRKFAPICKDQGGMACDPDNARFNIPERVQMRAGNGGAGS